MKKFYAAFCALATAAIALAQGQQVPNGGFEEAWSDCTPWTSAGNTKKKGTTPSSWYISHVIGMSGTGATAVGDKTEGYESESAVKLINTANKFRKSQIVPAYISLGKTWSTSEATLTSVKNSDGGAFDGIEFSDRPQGIEFMYKRSRGTTKPDEISTVVAYLWKGHKTQKDVPGDIVLTSIGGKVTKSDMQDRDRCVLGWDMNGCLGGDVTASEDFELIAKLYATITENTDEWTKFSANFEYFSDATPEKLNVIISAGDYFGGASAVGNDNTLTVDNVKLLYDEQIEEPNEGVNYVGLLSIDLSHFLYPDLEPETVPNQNLNIIPTGNNKCTIAIHNLIFQGESLGDIVVPNVTVIETNGVKSYDGEGNVSLLSGDIEATAHVYGTEDTNGNISLKIDVTCNSDTPNIFVTYNGKKDGTDGISGIEADENAPAEYYDMRGIRHNADALAPGLYIKRQGAKATKVIVK
ncbi:MAG: PCMD domain-containing protein [Lachnospiraceae bacterium]|nr:PCMD domain-containing protein [Lachnospiraceae bacterium]